MSVQLNHTIVWCNDKEKSSAFLVEMLGLKEPPIPFGPMLVVKLSNGVSMDFYQQEGKIALQHYAFLVSEEEFDQVFARVKAKGLTYWADPARQQPGEIYRHFGGRGIYFDDLNGHFLEVMTRPYDLGK
jgi:catechol 2,3-dioxygenase-like lactoylglutathione lyase family enzyme